MKIKRQIKNMIENNLNRKVDYYFRFSKVRSIFYEFDDWLFHISWESFRDKLTDFARVK